MLRFRWKWNQWRIGYQRVPIIAYPTLHALWLGPLYIQLWPR